MSGPQARAHRGPLLHALYPLETKVPGLRRVPLAARRATRRTLTAAAVRAHRTRCRRTAVVGITGSRGKTTTKDLLAHMLAAAGPTACTRHNDNDVYGVPATLLAVRPSDRFAVVEAGVARPGDFAWLAPLVRPDVAVLTGVADDHLPAFGSLEAIAAEKRRLLERATRAVVVWADDPAAERVARGLGAPVVRVGTHRDHDVRLEDVRLRWPDGLDADVVIEGRTVTASVALHARHFAPCVALALTAATLCGVPASRAAAAAGAFAPASGRMRPEPGPNGSILLRDEFKSRSGTAVAALRALAEIPAGRRIAVLGEVQEREHTSETYAPIAAELGTADAVLAVGRAGPPLEALDPRVRPIPDVAGAAAALASLLRPGDVALVHGASAQHLERIALLLDARARVGCRVTRCTLRWECMECPHLGPGAPARVVEAA